MSPTNPNVNHCTMNCVQAQIFQPQSALIIRIFPRGHLFRAQRKLPCNESSFVGHIIVICLLFLIFQCLQTNKSKQSYVGIESRFEAQNICFGPKKLASWKYSYDKCALACKIGPAKFQCCTKLFVLNEIKVSIKDQQVAHVLLFITL